MRCFKSLAGRRAPQRVDRRRSRRASPWLLTVVATILAVSPAVCSADGMVAGVAKVDITNRTAGPVNDPLYAKALVLKTNETIAVLITVDAVAIGEIGRISNEYLANVRARLLAQFQIDPQHVLINASHCHGVVCEDVEERTFQAVQAAIASLMPVTVGAGTGHEDRVMENRRLELKSGQTADVRHAYALPPDEAIAAVGPVDPEIGVLRLDRVDDGGTLAVVYNFACHPIQGVPSGGNTADITGFASRVIEENLGDDTVALFVQGCGGDINPVDYKDVDHPRSAEPLGNLLGLSTLRAVRKIECQSDSRLAVIHEQLTLPRADRTQRIYDLEVEQQRLLKQLRGTSLSLKTFLPLVVKYRLADKYPSNYAHRYLHEEQLGRGDLRHLDAENRRNLKAYLENIHIMEELTRLQTNLALLRKHQASLVESGRRSVDVEVVGLRVGPFVLLTFPGELTVRIGLNLKSQSPHEQTFVAGYTNGYIYYAPTAEQLQNPGHAQEDCDSILAPSGRPCSKRGRSRF